MVACVDGAADVHASANGPVLLEVGVVAFDRGSVGALLLPDLVCAAIALVAPVLGCTDVIRWVVVSHRFNNIIFDQRVIGPTYRAKDSSQHIVSDITFARGRASKSVLVALPLRG
jgi:hypothetical protein